VRVIAIGELLDHKYRVVGRLGAGGFGEVFLANDEAIPGRQLALKVLTQSSEGNHDDLIWEMRNLSRFSHPGIVSFHHHFLHSGKLVLVMEFCAGGSLDDRLVAGKSIELAEAFRWGTVLCDTLTFVHSKGIVHHDIKPANILFTLDRAIKLGDFGVANRDAGTRLYMPPEMLLGEAVAKTDPRVDVYSLGITLLEILTGSNPFEDMDVNQAIQSRIAQSFVPEDLPRWVQEVLLHATHPTPELRFQKMADFGEAISAKHVPYVFDGKRIKANVLAEKSESLLTRKKWKSAEKRAQEALHLAPNSAAALMAAGRCNLLLRRTVKARDYFTAALAINPRIHVQKELGWLNLEEGHLPIAISMLSDHLDRNAADFEAYNLLLKCFYLSERYEAGEELGRMMMTAQAPNACFENNRFLCRLLNGGYTEVRLLELSETVKAAGLLLHNLTAAVEHPRSWSKDGLPALRDKLVFQEYGFGVSHNAGKKNRLVVRLQDDSLLELEAPVISIGTLDANDIVLSDNRVSRRHALVLNLPNDVWLYDLGSAAGTKMGGERISGRVFLDGVHHVEIGPISLGIASRTDLLV
jgi:serine/threonine protein kinase